MYWSSSRSAPPQPSESIRKTTRGTRLSCPTAPPEETDDPPRDRDARRAVGETQPRTTVSLIVAALAFDPQSAVTATRLFFRPNAAPAFAFSLTVMVLALPPAMAPKVAVILPS